MKVTQVLVALSIAGLSAGAFAQQFQTHQERDAGQAQRIESSPRNAWPNPREAARREHDPRNQIVVRTGQRDLVVITVPVVVQRIDVRPIYVIQAVQVSAESPHS